MHKVNTIQEWVGDRPILIIGNGEVWTEPTGDEVVVRMNAAILEHPCDIWVDGMSYTFRWKHIKFPHNYKYVIRLDCSAKNTQEHPGFLLPKNEYRRMANQLKLERPTTGIMTLWWFKKYFPDNEKFVTGFNGDKNRYTNLPNGTPGIHAWDREREILEEWINDEVLRAV